MLHLLVGIGLDVDAQLLGNARLVSIMARVAFLASVLVEAELIVEVSVALMDLCSSLDSVLFAQLEAAFAKCVLAFD